MDSGSEHMLFDAHYHLAPSFSGQATPPGLVCTAHPQDWDCSILPAATNCRPFWGILPEAGPFEAKQYDVHLKKLSHLLNEHPHSGVGECGLDKRFYKGYPKEEQIHLLKDQMNLAERYRRPIVFHQVQAIGSLCEILEEQKLTVPFMIHGFHESEESLKRLLNLGAYISLGMGIKWNNEKLNKMIHSIPKNRLLLESDRHFPYPSKELEEHYLRCSQHLGIDKKELILIVQNNGTVFTNR